MIQLFAANETPRYILAPETSGAHLWIPCDLYVLVLVNTKPPFDNLSVHILLCVIVRLALGPLSVYKTSLTNGFTFFFEIPLYCVVDFSHDVSCGQISELKSALVPLSGHGEKYCSDTCLTRYLEARNWNITKSRKMLEESLKWRATYRPEDIRWVNELKLLFSFNPSQVAKHLANCLSA